MHGKAYSSLMAASALGMYSSRGRVLPGGRRRARLATGCPVRCCSCSSDRFKASASSSSSSSCRHHRAAPVMPAVWQGLRWRLLTAALTCRTQRLVDSIMQGLCDTVSGSAQSSLGLVGQRHAPQACCSALRLRHSQGWSRRAEAAMHLHEPPALPLRGRLLRAPGLALRPESRCSLVRFPLLLLCLSLHASFDRVAPQNAKLRCNGPSILMHRQSSALASSDSEPWLVGCDINTVVLLSGPVHR